MIGEGVALLTDDAAAGPPGTGTPSRPRSPPCTPRRPSWEATDWTEIVGLYDVLLHRLAVPVVALNRAVAIGLRRRPGSGSGRAGTPVGRAGAGHLRLPQRRPRRLPAAARATGRGGDAYEEALALTDNAVEREFLAARLAEVRR